MIAILTKDCEQVSEGVDFCWDLNSARTNASASKGFAKNCNRLVKRGVKVRVLSEITKDNAQICAEIADYCEMRHIQGITYLLMIADGKRIFNYDLGDKGKRSLKSRLTSKSQSFVRLQQSFFDSLWVKAVPIANRIKQLEEGIEPEVTEIITGWPAIVQRTIDGFLEAKVVDHCCDAAVPPRMADSPAKDVISDFASRGGKVRMITEITKENLIAVKELMKSQDIRHIGGFKLNFGVSDKMFSAPTSVYSLSQEPQCLWSNSQQLLKEHQYLFNKIWETALPAKIRIKEIEQGIAPDLIETISDPEQIRKLALQIIGNATNEILMIYPTAQAFLQFSRLGIMSLAENISAAKRDLSVKIITPESESIKQMIDKSNNNTNSKSKMNIKILEVAMQTGVSVIVADSTFSLSIELKDSSDIGLATYSNSRPTVLSYMSIFNSMWTQADLYEKIKSLYEQIQVRERQQKEFIDIAAHELRNPLEPILGLAKILRQHTASSKEQQLLDVIIRSAERLDHLQQEILDMGRIERNKFVISDMEKFDLNKLTRGLVDDLKRLREEDQFGQSVEIICNTNGVLEVMGNKSRLTQVISNLLNNALKFTNNGAVTIQTNKNSGGGVELHVVDTGQGIDPEIMPVLFTKFASRSAFGTGLGLYISKAIIEAHGGKIWAENNNGDNKGSSFHFVLPSAESIG